MDGDEDWHLMNSSDWECVRHLDEISENQNENDCANRKILAGLINMEKIVPYGAVIYNHFYQTKEVVNEIIASSVQGTGFFAAA